MKHFILFFLSLAFSSLAFTQEIPNGDLEDWQTVGGWFENPTGWITMNNQILVNAVQDSAACQGNLALKISPVGATESLMGSAELDFPLTYVPPSLQFCVKTNLDNVEDFVDTCRVKISFWNEDNMLYEEVWTTTESLTEWTEVMMPLNQIEPILTDCKITVQASFPGIGLGSGSPNTWISVDDFKFDSVDSIPIIELPVQFNIYPNPTDNGSIKISGSMPLGEIVIYDLLGNKLKELETNSADETIEFNFSTGIYLVKTLGQTKRLVVR